MSFLTKSTKPISGTTIKRAWYLVDVKGKRLGRVATIISTILQGKHKPSYIGNLDLGDTVVVINASQILLSGNKMKQKVYSFYSGFPGGLREVNAETLLKNNPSEMVRLAVSGMLPKNKLRDMRLARLHVYPDERHTYKGTFDKIIT